jgi:hypothetical protein
VIDPRKRYRSPFDFDLTKMTVEEAEERLRSMGIEPGTWVDNESYVKDGDQARIPTFEFYAEMLGHIRDICQDQVNHDVKEIDNLNYQLRRLKRGGGQ